MNMSWKPSTTHFGRFIDITEYLKSIDIIKAREVGVEIYDVQITKSFYNKDIKVLADNIKLWLKNEPELVEHKTTDVKTEKCHGERFRTYTDTYYFSRFKLTHISLDGHTAEMIFKSLSEKELLAYSYSDNLSVLNRTPTLLQIAFGVLKKYPSLNIKIHKIQS